MAAGLQFSRPCASSCRMTMGSTVRVLRRWLRRRRSSVRSRLSLRMSNGHPPATPSRPRVRSTIGRRTSMACRRIGWMARRPTAWRSGPGTLAAAKQAALLDVRGIALSAPAWRRARLQPLQTLAAACAADADPRRRSASRQRQLSPRAARAVLDPRLGARLRREDRPDKRSPGPRSLLVHRATHRRRRRRHGPLGGGAGMDLDYAAASRPHGRTRPQSRMRIPPARRSGSGDSVAFHLVARSRADRAGRRGLKRPRCCPLTT